MICGTWLVGDSIVSPTVTFRSGGRSYARVVTLSVVVLGRGRRVVSGGTKGVGEDGRGEGLARVGSTRRGVVGSGEGMKGVVVGRGEGDGVVVLVDVVVVERSSPVGSNSKSIILTKTVVVLDLRP